jgi:hypothetical protein
VVLAVVAKCRTATGAESVVCPEPGVTACTWAGTKLAGYLVVETEDLESAVALAKGCPNVRVGGGVKVGALADLPAEHAAEVLRGRQRSA